MMSVCISSNMMNTEKICKIVCTINDNASESEKSGKARSKNAATIWYIARLAACHPATVGQETKHSEFDVCSIIIGT